MNLATTLPSQASFFATARGQSATLIVGTVTSSKTKSYRDTNIEQANVVPTKMFKFVGISLAFVHTTNSAATNAADRDLILNGGYLQFRIVDKDILFLPLTNLPVLNPIAAATNNASMFSNPGGGQGQFMYKLPINITLNPYENFNVSLNFDGTVSITNSTDVYCVLQGFQRRPT